MYPDQHNYLIHWLKKGEKAKYVDKIKLANGRWRYFYSQAELEAYKLKRKLGASAGELANKAKQGLHGLKEGALDAGARVVVGASKRSQAVSNALGGEWKREAQQFTSDANKHQRTANSHNQKALASSAKAASAERFRRHGGTTIDGVDANAVEGRHREVSEKYARTSWTAAQKASNARRLAANAQKNYEQTTLGKAEARVRAADLRKAQAKSAKATNKPATRTPEGQKVGSIFRDAQGDLDRLKREQEARKKSRSSSVFKDGQADLERQKRERESRAKQKNFSVFKNGREELERQKTIRSKSNRPQSRKKYVTSGGTGVHKRRRTDYSRFER